MIRRKTRTELILSLKRWGMRCKFDLCGANLYRADLCGANLCGADLCGADLRDADLYSANLYGANLRGANLCGANLYRANLRGANLRDANLYGANLWIFKTTKHRCIFVPWQNIMKIGCHEHQIDDWVNHYREIGKKEGYTPIEIDQYGQFIRMCGNMEKDEEVEE